MNEVFTFSLTVFTGFFAIMNPFANIPIFLSLTDDADEKVRLRINKKAVITAFFIVTVFVLLGKLIFDLFGITIPAFKITGGLLIFRVGFDMLQSKKSEIKHLNTGAVDENIAVSPLAIPILAGPGTIVTAMNFISHNSYVHITLVIIIFALMCYLTYLAFRYSEFFMEKMGHNIMTVIEKIMGLILAIMGTGMVIEGIKLAFNIV